jgi:exo-beta-1,3-glucanase (GH17 family)
LHYAAATRAMNAIVRSSVDSPVTTTATLTTASPTQPQRLGAVFVALIITIALVALNGAVWRWLNPPLTAPDGPEKARGVAYSGFQRHQDPRKEIYPSEAELTGDIKRIAGFAQRMRTYSATENALVPGLAASYGLPVTAGAWLDTRADNNELEIAALVSAVRQHRNIDRVVVGNEAILRGNVSVDEMISYVRRVKRLARRHTR